MATCRPAGVHTVTSTTVSIGTHALGCLLTRHRAAML